MQFIIFFSIILGVFIAINYYLFMRGMQALPGDLFIKRIYAIGFWLIASAYFAGRILEKIQISQLSDILVWIGSFWLGAMLYFLIIILLLDTVRGLDSIFHFFPEVITGNYTKVKFITLFVSIAIVSGVLIGGFFNARNPVVRHVEIQIKRQSGGLEQLNAVLISDIHLGTIIGNGFLEKVVNSINDLNPDIIFIAGDILDEDLEPVIRQNLGETLRKLHAPMGVFAIMGNHEHIGGAEPAFEYLVSHGFVVLRDSVVNVNNNFYIIGRDDKEAGRFGSKERISLNSLYNDNIIDDLPVILLDHQPADIQSAVDLGIDVQFSGHTHKGQLWPINHLVNALFKVGYGHKIIENLNIYVTSGIGTWGPPIRIGSSPEIVSVKIIMEN
jgi:uncharacterized protein